VIAEAPLSAPQAAELNRRGVTTAIGKPWHTTQVARMRDRLGLWSDRGLPKNSLFWPSKNWRGAAR